MKKEFKTQKTHKHKKMKQEETARKQTTKIHEKETQILQKQTN